MKTLSKLAAVAALTFAAVASTASAQAGDYCFAPPTCHVPTTYAPAPVCRSYTIFYRDCPHSAWTVYGTFHRVHDVIRTANYIEGLGYETFVR
jgi:hypothetical protein